MADFNGAVGYAGKHPVQVGLGVVVVGLIFMLLMRKPPPAENSGGGGGIAAFYQAQAVQSGVNAQIRAAEMQSNAAVAISGQRTGAAVQISAINAALAEDLASIDATSRLNQTNAEGWWQHILAHNYNVGLANSAAFGYNANIVQLRQYIPPSFGG